MTQVGVNGLGTEPTGFHDGMNWDLLELGQHV
jgi:hypothetical protein